MNFIAFSESSVFEQDRQISLFDRLESDLLRDMEANRINDLETVKKIMYQESMTNPTLGRINKYEGMPFSLALYNMSCQIRDFVNDPNSNLPKSEKQSLINLSNNLMIISKARHRLESVRNLIDSKNSESLIKSIELIEIKIQQIASLESELEKEKQVIARFEETGELTEELILILSRNGSSECDGNLELFRKKIEEERKEDPKLSKRTSQVIFDGESQIREQSIYVAGLSGHVAEEITHVLNSHYIAKDLKDLIDLGKKIKTVDSEKIKDECFDSMHHNIIAELERTGEALIAGGYVNALGGHAVLYRIKKETDGTYTFGIINTGEGRESHPGLRKTFRTQSEYKIIGLSRETVLNKETLKFLTLSTDRKSIEEVYEFAKEKFVGEGKGREVVSTSFDDYGKGQYMGNCSHKCLVRLIRSNFSTETYYKFKLSSISKTYSRLERLATQNPDDKEVRMLLESGKKVMKIRRQKLEDHQRSQSAWIGAGSIHRSLQNWQVYRDAGWKTYNPPAFAAHVESITNTELVN